MSLDTKFLLSKFGTYGSFLPVIIGLGQVQGNGMVGNMSAMYLWLGFVGFFTLLGCGCYIWKRILEDARLRQLDADRIYVQTLGKTNPKDWK